MTALQSLVTHLSETHDPAALQTYEAEKRRVANEKVMQDYLEVAALVHESGCFSRLVGSVEWCTCRRKRLLEAVRERHREMWRD